jgi:hypothetical protein
MLSESLSVVLEEVSLSRRLSMDLKVKLSTFLLDFGICAVRSLILSEPEEVFTSHVTLLGIYLLDF